MKKYQVGIIGCGRIAYKHFDALKKINNVEIKAVCDIKPDRAKKYAEQFQIPFYLDYRKMLSNEDLDVVSVLTPSGTHPGIAIDVMNSGRNVIVEKPMALLLQDADRMIECADKNGVKLFVVKQNRFNLAVQKARVALQNDRFGKLVLGTVRVRWCRNQAYYDQDDWRGTWAMDGGVLANQASHHIDLLQWFMGPVESVMAITTCALVKIETEDTAVAILRFVNGALGIIEATTATRPKDIEGSLSLLGEKGTVEIGGFAVNKIKIWNFIEETKVDENIRKDFSENPPNVYGNGHEPYLRQVFESLDSGRTSLVEGLEGRKSIEIINALYESAVTGKQVFIHNQFKNSPLGR